VSVQIAHLAGAGGYGDAVDAALGVLVDAIGKRDSRVRNLWFDASVVVRPGMTAEELKKIAARIRQIGVERVLYGSDAAASPATYPEAGWAAFQRLPLTAAEFRVMTSNVAPYLRDLVAGDVFQSPVFVSAPGNVIAAHELFRRLDLDVTIDNARRETVPSCPPGC
jgi:hypothetical protein